MYLQFDQVHQAHQQVLGNLEGPRRKQYAILQALFNSIVLHKSFLHKGFFFLFPQAFCTYRGSSCARRASGSHQTLETGRTELALTVVMALVRVRAITIDIY